MATHYFWSAAILAVTGSGLHYCINTPGNFVAELYQPTNTAPHNYLSHRLNRSNVTIQNPAHFAYPQNRGFGDDCWQIFHSAHRCGQQLITIQVNA